MAAHDNTTCPAYKKSEKAHIEATQIHAMTKDIPKERQGLSPWRDMRMQDIPSSAECMLPGADTNTNFSNAAAAQEYRRMLLIGGVTDNTIPRTFRERRAHVMALVKAFKCVPVECEDRDDMKKWFVEQRHHNQLVEAKCWEILEECCLRSTKQTNLVEAHEPGKFKFKPGNMSFAERFDIIKDTMAISKTICKHLFDVAFTLKFVDDPAHNRARVESNRILNGKKAEIMKRGKQEQERERHHKRPKLEHHASPEFQTEEDFEDNEYDFHARSVKGERTSSTSDAGRSARVVSTRQNHHAGRTNAVEFCRSMPPPSIPETTFVRQSPHNYDPSSPAGYTSMGYNSNSQLVDTSAQPQQNYYNSLVRHHTPSVVSSSYSPQFSAQTPAHIMRPGSSLSVMSHHSVCQTPRNLSEAWIPPTPTPANAYRSAPMAQNTYDMAVQSSFPGTNMDHGARGTTRLGPHRDSNIIRNYNPIATPQAQYPQQAPLLDLQPPASPDFEEVVSNTVESQPAGSSIPENGEHTSDEEHGETTEEEWQGTPSF